MQVHVNAPNTQLSLIMDVEDFLHGPVMSHLCSINNDCAPEQVVRDYLPPSVCLYDDDDEIAAAVEEACVLACNASPYGADPVMPFQVTGVDLEEGDIAWARQQLLGLHMVEPEEVPLDAA
jgi:hypothetical protein